MQGRAGGACEMVVRAVQTVPARTSRNPACMETQNEAQMAVAPRGMCAVQVGAAQMASRMGSGNKPVLSRVKRARFTQQHKTQNVWSSRVGKWQRQARAKWCRNAVTKRNGMHVQPVEVQAGKCREERSERSSAPSHANTVNAKVAGSPATRHDNGGVVADNEKRCARCRTANNHNGVMRNK